MVDRLQENLGKYPYIDLDQVKDYLSISSTSADARLSNIINYATGVVEHYIGQEILANDYVEVFDGGKSSVLVSRLPLSNVYSVSEFNGQEEQILDDPTTIGTPVTTSTDALSLSFKGDAHLNGKVKKFGKSSLELFSDGDYVLGAPVTDQLKFEEGNFTIEMFIRVDQATLQDNVIFSINTDASNYMQFRLANQYGLEFEANVDGTAISANGPNTLIESQQFAKRQWAHVAVTRDLDNEKIYMHYNGNVIADQSYTVANLTFTTNVEIGSTFKGYLDEVRVSDQARYTGSDFSVNTKRFRPDNDTALLIHFDGKNGATEAKDVHNAVNEFNFSRDMGEITRDTGGVGVRGTYPTSRNSYPALTLAGPPAFQAFPSGVKVDYRAGYESDSVPQDIQLATLDFIKLIYKQDQEKKGFSFEGERGDNFPLAGNFPPHIRRILDLYRIIA
jgi:hypothetical protein